MSSTLLTTILEQPLSKVTLCYIMYKDIQYSALCTDPRKSPEGAAGGPIGHYGVPVTYERSFRWKVSNFRNLCAVGVSFIEGRLILFPLQSNGLPQHIKIVVSRDSIFEDSFGQVSLTTSTNYSYQYCIYLLYLR